MLSQLSGGESLGIIQGREAKHISPVATLELIVRLMCLSLIAMLRTAAKCFEAEFAATDVHYFDLQILIFKKGNKYNHDI